MLMKTAKTKTAQQETIPKNKDGHLSTLPGCLGHERYLLFSVHSSVRAEGHDTREELTNIDALVGPVPLDG